MKQIYHTELQRFKHDYARIFIWVIGICTGLTMIWYMTLVNDPERATALMGQLSEQISRQADMFGGRLDGSYLSLFLFILMNNLYVTGLILFVGFLPFVVLPFFYSFTTFLSLGTVLAAVKLKGESPLMVFLTGILPHGFVEIVAMILASSIAIFMSLHIFKKIFSAKRKELHLRLLIWQAVRSYLLLVVPLVFLAALIEGFITPMIIQTFY